MLTVLRSLYNNGVNEGDIVINTNDGLLKCHGYVVNTMSSNIKHFTLNNEYGTYKIPYSSELLNLILNFLYSEKVLDIKLSAIEIIDLHDLINQLNCKEPISILKNHYLKKFPSLLTLDNWLQLLRIVCNIPKYSDFCDNILYFYTTNVLINIDDLYVDNFSSCYQDLNAEIKALLFSVTLKHVISLNNELKHSNEIIKSNKQSMNTFLKKADSDENSGDSQTDNQIDNHQLDTEQKLVKLKGNISTHVRPMQKKK